MKKDTHDDEIGLTNYITVGPQGDKHPSRESVSEDYDHSIAVQSAFEQSSSPINHQRGG
jgi:hypothetical protein